MSEECQPNVWVVDDRPEHLEPGVQVEHDERRPEVKVRFRPLVDRPLLETTERARSQLYARLKEGVARRLADSPAHQRFAALRREYDTAITKLKKLEAALEKADADLQAVLGSDPHNLHGKVYAVLGRVESAKSELAKQQAAHSAMFKILGDANDALQLDLRRALTAELSVIRREVEEERRRKWQALAEPIQLALDDILVVEALLPLVHGSETVDRLFTSQYLGLPSMPEPRPVRVVVQGEPVEIGPGVAAAPTHFWPPREI